jgi:hypothetical protein
MKSLLKCIRRPRLVKSQYVLSFCYLKRRSNKCECSASGGKIWNSYGTNFILEHITYSDGFNFHSCDFQFMSDVTVKWYTFHVYVLHLVQSYNEATNAGIMLHVLIAQNATDVCLFYFSYHLKILRSLYSEACQRNCISPLKYLLCVKL